ncbi:SANT/Myb-like DNA-binding domain-containing protein [Aspergillus stella-maris]|uniref:SANT/Myb-like DNA-binding domain-containing protein n=1 Tax=Aspergillus stella-maris TaxID=1810926 RepID=UPI003CCDE049
MSENWALDPGACLCPHSRRLYKHRPSRSFSAEVHRSYSPFHRRTMQSNTDPNTGFSAPSRYRRQPRERWTDEETIRLCELRDRHPDIPWADFQVRYHFSHRSVTALMQRYCRNREGGGSRSSRPANATPASQHPAPAPNRQGTSAQHYRRVTLGQFWSWGMNRERMLGLGEESPVFFDSQRYMTLPPIFPQATPASVPSHDPRVMGARPRAVPERSRPQVQGYEPRAVVQAEVPQVPSHPSLVVVQENTSQVTSNESRPAIEESEPETLSHEPAQRQINELNYDDSDGE